MPEHIHLLMSEPEKGNPSRVMPALKQGFARRVQRQIAKRRVAGQQDLFLQEVEPVWATTLLRLQCVERAQTYREATLHPS